MKRKNLKSIINEAVSKALKEALDVSDVRQSNGMDDVLEKLGTIQENVPEFIDKLSNGISDSVKYTYNRISSIYNTMLEQFNGIITDVNVDWGYIESNSEIEIYFQTNINSEDERNVNSLYENVRFFMDQEKRTPGTEFSFDIRDDEEYAVIYFDVTAFPVYEESYSGDDPIKGLLKYSGFDSEF